MNRLVIDMETRSRQDLKVVGVYEYAFHESTDVLCIAVKKNDEPTKLWVSGVIDHDIGIATLDNKQLSKLIEQADFISAHNAGFERLLWSGVMCGKYGFDPIPKEKWICTAALAAFYALPRDLERVCGAIGLPIEKDMDGRRIMLKMCKPRKPTKNNPSEWWELKSEYIKLCIYCITDVDAEYALEQALRPLPEHEIKVYTHTELVNDRGVCIDLKGVDYLINLVDEAQGEYAKELSDITDKEVTAPTQTAKMLKYINDETSMGLTSMKAGVVDGLLSRDELEDNVRRVLEIRKCAGLTSVKKLNAMDARTNNDSRIRGNLMYHAASTGRFGGKGIQPQNMPRDCFEPEDVDVVLSSNRQMIQMMYGDPVKVASQCIRGLVTAGEGKKLVCSDFSQIEARVLAWVAGDKRTVKVFEDGLDIYKVAASDIYKMHIDDINKSQRFVGKTATLALGYQGWTGAFSAMCEAYGASMEQEEMVDVISAWRESHPEICSFWKGVENAAIEAIRTGQPVSYKSIKFGRRDNFLHIRLPSGRLISYFEPSLECGEDMYGRPKVAIRFMGIDTYTKQWSRQSTYGGKLTENIVQAISRDILIEAMFRLERKGFPVVLHVHDEVICEVDDDGNSYLNELNEILTETPEWCSDLPVAADGWEGKRYRK